MFLNYFILFGLNFSRKSKWMSVLMFPVGMEKPLNTLFLNVYTKSTSVEQSDLFGLLHLISCFWQSLCFHFSSDFALVGLSLCFPGTWEIPETFQVTAAAPGQELTALAGPAVTKQSPRSWCSRAGTEGKQYLHLGAIHLKHWPRIWSRVKFYYIVIYSEKRRTAVGPTVPDTDPGRAAAA